MKILNQNKTTAFDSAAAYLSPKFIAAAARIDSQFKEAVNEIRLRAGGTASLSVGENFFYLAPSGITRERNRAIFCGDDDVKFTVNRLCGGSYHAHAHTIKDGFIVTEKNIRAGVCGETLRAGEYEIDSINSVCIRISRFIDLGKNDVLDIIAKNGLVGIIIYSPPAGGKTTLLRSIVNSISKGLHGSKIYSTALIDERREVFIEGKMSGGLLDVLSGYPKAKGMEIAVRTMNPQVLVCDEINCDDAENIFAAQNAGVPLIATTHAGGIENLRRRPGIDKLINGGIFKFAAGLELKPDGLKISCCEL